MNSWSGSCSTDDAPERAEKREKQPFDYIRSRPELLTQVMSVLQSFSKLRPDVARLHFTLGGLHEVSRDLPNAIRSYERYLRVNPRERSALESACCV